jgi:2-keto-4-pentenoate hydratase/2-oxohepta-3-ene-1,7-dioic acid hydratase in catechol pathway
VSAEAKITIIRFRLNGQVRGGSLSEDRIVSSGDIYNLSEVAAGSPDEPILFLKPPSAVIGQEGKIVIPKSSQRVDYEGELGVVMGKRCKYVSADDVNKYVLGYTCFNDVTARDLQQKDGQWTRAKSFDTFAPIGPWIASTDPSDADIKTRVNGQVKQSSNTSDLIFGVPQLSEFISHVMTLEPGDVICHRNAARGGPAGEGRCSGGGDRGNRSAEKPGGALTRHLDLFL